MISKNKLKELSVYKQQKHCEQDSVFVVEGVKMCHEAMAANVPIKVVCATNSWLSQHIELPLSAEVYEVDADSLSRLSYMTTPNEVWMLVERTPITAPTGQPLTLALDHLQDPGNLGTIIRTADWFGFRHIVCSTDCVEFYNPKTIQATMGSFAHLVPHYTDLVPFLRTLAPRRRILGAFLNGESLNTFKFQSSDIIVIGSESNGISPEVEQLVSQRITIPSPVSGRATAESLNAAIAAAIIMCRFAQ